MRRQISSGVNNNPGDLDMYGREAESLDEREAAISAQFYKKHSKSHNTNAYNSHNRQRNNVIDDAENDKNISPTSPLHTKYNARTKNEIERKKYVKIHEDEQKRALIEKKRLFSEQVRDTFGSNTGGQGTGGSDSPNKVRR